MAARVPAHFCIPWLSGSAGATEDAPGWDFQVDTGLMQFLCLGAEGALLARLG